MPHQKPFSLFQPMCKSKNHSRLQPYSPTSKYSKYDQQTKAYNSIRQIVESHVIKTIENQLQIENLGLNQLENEPFEPNILATNLISAMHKAFGQYQITHSTKERDVFFQQVSKALNQGFKESKDILNNLHALTDKIESSINETHALTLKLMPTIEASLNQNQLAQTVEHNIEIPLETSQGITIYVSIHSLPLAEPEKTFAPSYASKCCLNHLDYFINANLKALEQKSIHNLLTLMQNTSDSFFYGKAKNTLMYVHDLGLDSNQIKPIATDLSVRKSVQAAAYYQQNIVTGIEFQPYLIAQASQFINQTVNSFTNQNSTLSLFQEPLNTFNLLFMTIGNLIKQPSETSESWQVFSEFVKFLGILLVSQNKNNLIRN